MPHPVKTAVLFTSGLSASALLLLLYLKRKKQEVSNQTELSLEDCKQIELDCDKLAADTLLLEDLGNDIDLPELLGEISKSASCNSQQSSPDLEKLSESPTSEYQVSQSPGCESYDSESQASESPVIKSEASELQNGISRVSESHDSESQASESPVIKSEFSELLIGVSKVSESQVDEVLISESPIIESKASESHLRESKISESQVCESLKSESYRSASPAPSESISECESSIGEMTEHAAPEPAQAVDESAANDNNNDQTVTNYNYADDADAACEEVKRLTVNEPESQKLTVDCDRVNKWLAKNEPFSHATGGHTCTEEGSDDSGRPSSVDTESTSPRTGRHDSQQQQHHHHLRQESPSDRNKVVRGVSPVPGDDNDIIHQFLIPNKLGGSMVGTRGRNINYIRAKSGASVWISRNFFDKKTQVVNVRGPVECVRNALQVIKKRFPELDVKPINTAVPIQRNPALQPTMCQLSLPVGVQLDVNICAMCRGTTLFMQQPTHPSFHHLEKMDYTIMKHYADHNSVPALPRPVNPGAVCVAPFGNSWYRAIIADVFPEDDMVLMKYLDWGGYERMPVGNLKQIRTEMMHLPFQAVEGHLAYVTPVLDQDADTEAQLEQLSHKIHEKYLGSGKRIKCQVVYYNDVGQPCVYLYTRDSTAGPWRFLQEELVQAGLVQWFQMAHLPPQLPQA